MEDNDKRKSSVPGASSAPPEDRPSVPGARRSEPDLFDAHEATLPRFTIDPGEAPRQRTRTLLGVPTLVSESEEGASRAPAPPPPPTVPTVIEAPAPPTPPTPPVASAIFDAQDRRAAPQTLRDAQTQGLIDISVDVEDYLSEVTMVSDADVVALPDTTGQLQPVRVDGGPAAVASQTDASRETTASSTEAIPSSLAPREISRGAAKPQAPREPSGRGGALLVAAVMLLATGAWFLTAGTFRRATLSTASDAATAAATQPVSDTNSMAMDKKVAQPPAAPAEAPTPVPTSAETVSSAAPLPTAAQKPATDDVASPALKNKPALTATARGERVRRTARAGKASATPAPTGEVPQGPSRAEVVTRLETVRPAVQACAAGRSGVADLDVTIAHTGVVMHVLVGGDFAGTTEGSCIARAVRGARFPAFKQERFRLLYPYAI